MRARTDLKSIRRYILAYLLMSAVVILIAAEYYLIVLPACLVVSLIGISSILLSEKYNSWPLRMVALTFNPLSFLLGMAIGIWMKVITPGWEWISVIFISYWGLWLIPIFLPEIGRLVESEIFKPKTKAGKFAIGVAVGFGAMGATLGRLISRSGSMFAHIFLGFSMAIVAYGFQFLIVYQNWERREKWKSTPRRGK